MTKLAKARPSTKPGFQLERKSGLSDPRERLEWAGELAAYFNRYRSQKDIGDVGPLSIARTRYEDETAAEVQFRSEPLTGCGGGEFRFELSHGHKHRHWNAILHHLGEAERRLVANRSELARIVHHVRDMASDLIGRQEPDHPPALIVAICCVHGIRTPMHLQVDLEILGNSLTSGVARVWGPSVQELERRLGLVLSSHARRHRLRSSLHGLGFRGSAAASVEPLLVHAGMSMDFVVDHLEGQKELRFRCGRAGSVRAWLSWEDGMLNCGFKDLAFGLAFSKDELTIGGRMLPETALLALPGRRLDALVLHPCLPPDAMIVSATQYRQAGGGVAVALEPSKTPLPNSALRTRKGSR